MRIYTSYFGNLKKLQDAGIATIGIARFPPKHFYGTSLLSLAPKSNMLQMAEQQYREEFKKILASLNPHTIYQRIQEISEGKDVALLCFEKPNEFCHRKMVAHWLIKNLGIEVTEYGLEHAGALEKSIVQLSLF